MFTVNYDTLFFRLKTGVTQKCGKKVSHWHLMDVAWSTWWTLLARAQHLMLWTKTTGLITAGRFSLRTVVSVSNTSMRLRLCRRTTISLLKMTVHRCLIFMDFAFRRRLMEWFGKFLWRGFFVIASNLIKRFCPTASHVETTDLRFTQAQPTAQLL